MKSTLSKLSVWAADSRLLRDGAFSGISTDSRQVEAGNLFIALRGERFDAHNFLPAVLQKGAAAVLVERMPEGLDIPALLVPDTRIALGEMATGLAAAVCDCP